MPAHQTVIPGSSGVLACVTDAGATIVPTVLLGWNAESVAASVFALYDGTSTGGKLLATVELAAGVEQNFEYADPLEVDSGSLYVSITSGTPTGSVLWA